MCIICNGEDQRGGELASNYLSSFRDSGRQMRKAIDDLAAFRNHLTDRDTIAQYDAHHKRLTRMLRDWNRSDMDREPSCGCGPKSKPGDGIFDTKAEAQGLSRSALVKAIVLKEIE